MGIDDEPTTNQELARRLRILYDASDHSGGARDDFWDTVSFHIGWIVDLVERAAKVNGGKTRGGKAGGVARAAALSPERRTEIAKQAADARWGRSPCPHCGTTSDAHNIMCKNPADRRQPREN